MLLRVQIAPVFVGQAGQQAIAVGRATKNTVSRRRVSFGLPLFEQEAVGQAQDDIPCFPMVRHGVEFGRRGAAFSACGRGCWLGFGIVCLILCLGAWIELRLSPFLLRALLERFF